MRNIIIADPYSTGYNLVEDVVRRGYNPVVLETIQEKTKDLEALKGIYNMEALLSIVFYLAVIDRKKSQIPTVAKESSAMPHEHRRAGYILLNGGPVRVADLEGK